MNREGADWRKVRQGTLQHEVFVGDNATPFENNSNLEIRVICKKMHKILMAMLHMR